MTENKKISVIMSVFNAEKYLSAAVESILNQTYSDFEFIIIEDASTDRSLEILEAYANKDSRIFLIKNKINKASEGFIKNLNLGLKHAKGAYIARMDADDISDLTRFQKQIQFLEENKEVFIVGSAVQFIGETGENIKLLSAHKRNEDIQKNMCKNISMYHPVVFWRNNGKIFYREKMLACEDYDLYFRMMTDGYKFANINETLLQYRILTDSISRKNSKLIRWIFVEKTRQFFNERKKTGKDSYDSFKHKDYLNILVPNFKNKSEDLLFSAKVALKYSDYEGFKIIIKKAEQFFPHNRGFKNLKLLLKLPKKFQLIFVKFSHY